jgi:D-alanyl-D-alanine carboxypeptidase (penicillin-binding protein 5/6)
MKKLLILLTISILSFNSFAAFFITPEPPKLAADSFALIDYNSLEVIASKNIHKQRAPASLTKLMTSYVVLKRLQEGFAKLEDTITISKKAWKTGGSRSFLKVGSKVKLETLLKGMIIQSGNDASVALAEHIAGTEMTFVALMNKYAQTLGMTNTNFENASGLPQDGQVSTSYDMALLSIAIIKEFPKYYKWYGEKYFTHNNIKQPNRNKLLWSDKTIDGLKTGYTKKAGYCLVASAKRLNMRLISVVLGTSSANARESQTRQLLDYGFRFFETSKIDLKDQIVEVYKGSENKLKVGIKNEKYLTLERGKFTKLAKKLTINSPIIAPIATGDEVGELTISFEDKIITNLPLVAKQNVEEAGFFGSIIDSISLWF